MEEVVYESPTEGRHVGKSYRGLYDGFDSVLDAAKAYAMEPELIIDGPASALRVSALLSDLIDIIEGSNLAEPRSEEVITETPHGVKYRVDFTQDTDRVDWLSDGYFETEEAARKRHESNERMGYFSRIVKVVA